MFKPEYPDLRNPEYLTACCGIHVRKLASIIAVVCIVLSVLELPFIIFAPTQGLSWTASIPLLVIGVVTYVCVLCADKMEKPVLYWPFLILHAICMALILLEIIGVVVLMIIPTSSWSGIIPKHTLVQQRVHEGNRTTTVVGSGTESGLVDEDGKEISRAGVMWVLALVLVFLVVVEIITFLCWNVVRKARRYMVDEVISGKTARSCNMVHADDRRPQHVHPDMKV